MSQVSTKALERIESVIKSPLFKVEIFRIVEGKRKLRYKTGKCS